MKKAQLLRNPFLSFSYLRSSYLERFKSIKPLEISSRKSSTTETRPWKKPSVLMALPFLCLAMASLMELSQEASSLPFLPNNWVKLEVAPFCSLSLPGFYEAYGVDSSQEFYLSLEGEIYSSPSFLQIEGIQSCFPIPRPQQIEEIL